MSTHRDEDRERVRRAVAGDRAAFDELVRRSREPVLATVRRMIGEGARDKVDPDDVVQDVFATAWASLGEFRDEGPSSLRRWLEGIARNRVRHICRLERRRAELLALLPDRPPATSPSRTVRRAERFERLRDSVDGLSPEYREVVRLARIEGLSIRAIAAELQKSESAVKNLLLRAMKALRATMPETESLSLPNDRRLGETAAEPGGRDDDL